MKILTVKDVLKLAQYQVKQGRGDLPVMITSDDECNEIHSLFFGFTYPEGKDKDYYREISHDGIEGDFVVLG